MKKSWFWFGFLVLLVGVVGLAIWMAGLSGGAPVEGGEGREEVEETAVPSAPLLSSDVPPPEMVVPVTATAKRDPVSAPSVDEPLATAPASSPEPGAVTKYFDASEFVGDSPEEYVSTLDEVFRRFQKVYGENPVGSHREVVAALTGANPKKVAFIDPAKVKAGVFVDRWGTPFVFHAQSGTEMEVRSAGPDQQPFTADDIVGIHGP